MFKQARVKLTIFYTAIVLLIVILFSLTSVVLLRLDLASEAQLAPDGTHFIIPLDEEFQDSRRTFIALAIVNPLLVLLSVLAGWMLAGRTLNPIQKSMNQQKRFVSDAAHELRTPLTIMKAGLETIEAGSTPGTDDYKHLNRELREEIDRIVSLTNDLLFLSRGELLAQTAVKTEISLSQLAARSVQVMQPYAAQNGISLTAHVEPEILCQVDEDQMNRMLLNLLKNAIDYNSDGGEVFLRLAQNGRNKILLEVSDTGIGIAEDDIKHVFERFFKADDSRARSRSGTGLGLAIVKTIVDAHDGDIDVHSQVGKGTRVTVSLHPVD